MKSSSTIDLIKTSNGYSIIQDDQLINKPATHLQSQNTHQSTNKNSKQKGPQLIPKKFLPQQTFTIYPYTNLKTSQTHPYLIIPSRTQWFNLNSIHDIQRKSLPEWFKQKKGLLTTSMNSLKFQKNQELYKKYRNYIIQLGKSKYVTPTIARRDLAGDACAIIRIHSFLDKWGLVNFIHKRQTLSKQNAQQNGIQQNSVHQEKSTYSFKRKDGFDKDKGLISKSYDKDDLELLKKITKRFRPACTSCESLCGISWYEYNEILTKKYFPIDKESSTVNSGQQFQYTLRICYSCIIEKNYPVILGIEDFVKKSLVDEITQIDFDDKFGKRKTQQWVRFAETVEKHKFSIAKCSNVLKIEEKQLVDILVQMPIQNLQKISRIQPQTEDQIENSKDKQVSLKNGKENQFIKGKKQDIEADSSEELKIFQSNLSTLDIEQKKLYQQFLQAWLLKMYTKMQELQQWDKSVQWKVRQNESIKRHNIAQKMRKNLKLQE